MMKKNNMWLLVFISFLFTSSMLEGMSKRKEKSDSDLKETKYLEVVGISAGGDAAVLSDRPHSSLDGERRKSGGSKKHSPIITPSIIRTSSQHSARSDSSIDEGKISSATTQHLELRPIIHSVAEHDRLGILFKRWYHYVTDKKAILLNKLVSPLLRVKALSNELNGLRAGKRAEMAVLFCDIRNFTSITELNEPECVMGMLNEYFGSIVKIISKNNGVVDKFIGDAVLAEYFIDPKDVEDEEDPSTVRNEICANAVKSALEIIEFTKGFDIAKFNLKDDEEHSYLANSRLQNGIGITFGNVIFGALGGDDRYELTVIGDEVNLASRLQDLNKNPDISKQLERPIVISQRVYDLLPRDEYGKYFIPLGLQHIKGKKNSVSAFGYGKLPLDSTVTGTMVAANEKQGK